MTLILLVAGATLVASFFCSLFEAALYAITPSQVELLKQRKVRGAELLAKLRAEIEEPIAAILTINTIAHTVGSAWCGSIVGTLYGSRAVGIFAAIFTFLVLAVTEIVPKSLGVRYARTLAPRVAFPIQVMSWIAYPVARPARAAMRLLTSGEGPKGPSEDEVLLFSKLAAKHGGVREDEHQWVQGALRLDRFQAGDLRTPRTVVETLGADLSLSEVRALAPQWTHSRVPLVETGKPDQVVGLVYRREVLDAVLAGRDDLTLRDLVHPLQFVPESMPAHDLLDLFITERRHMVALTDEYGGFEGVVTLEDVLECLLGEKIVDEHDEFDDLQEVARQRSRLEADGSSGEPAP